MTAQTVLVRAADPADVTTMLQVSNSAQKWMIDNGLCDPAEQPAITEARMGWFSKRAEVGRDWSTNAARLFVAERDGVIAGWTMASLGYPPYFPETDLNQLYIGAMYVHRDHAGKGVGAALVEFLKKEALDGIIEIIRAECRKGKLVEYYQSFGFTPVPYTGPFPDWPTDKAQMLEMDLREEREKLEKAARQS